MLSDRVQEAEVVSALKLILAPGQVTELRVLDAVTDSDRQPHTESGFFDDPEKLAKAAATIIAAKGIYFTPNPVASALLARAPNQIQKAGKGTPTSDRDISSRRYLLVDCDPERPSGLSSNEAEHQASIDLTAKIRESLAADGWPEPIQADSGNGAHLLYRIDVPADDGGLVKRCLKALAARFDTNTVKVDKAVHNASRIWKLPGTLACKGEPTVDRPHRTARVLKAPGELTVVGTALLESLGGTAEQGKPVTKSPVIDRPILDAMPRALAAMVGKSMVDNVDGSSRLYAYACTAVEYDLNDADAVSAIRKAAESNQFPRDWTDGDILKRVRDAEKKVTRGAAAVPNIWPRHGRTDAANAKRFVAAFGDRIRYVDAWRKWLVWDEQRWAIDDRRAIDALAKEYADGLWSSFASGPKGDSDVQAVVRFVKSANSASGIANTIALARSEPGIAIKAGELDADRFALNVANGTVDLRTGELREHCRADFLTKLSPVPFNPTAACPAWKNFLETIFKADVGLITWLQRLLGYCLTGDTREQILTVFHGSGANGKSTLTTALTNILGEYAGQAPPTLMIGGDAHPTDVAGIAGKRLVIASETGDGKQLAEAKIKQLTGSERLTARRMFQDFSEFDPEAKFILATNHKPVIQGTDHAIWRRLRLVPFAVTIPDDEQDKSLGETLRAEYPGILAWLVTGCVNWQEHGLGELPSTIKDATAQYRAAEDSLGEFLESCCTRSAGTTASASQLLSTYRQHTGDSVTPKKLSSLLREHGFTSQRITSGRDRGKTVWLDLAIAA